MNRILIAALLSGAATASTPALAQQPAESVDELLQQVRNLIQEQSAADKARLKKFRANRDEQRGLLRQEKERLTNLERRSRALEAEFAANEKKLADLEALLKDRQGTKGELFGVARQVAGDLRAQLEDSLISAQYQDRADQLIPLTKAKDVPSIDQLQKVWLLMQEEMTYSGQVVRFETDVVNANGQTETTDVIRVGPFTASHQDRFLNWKPRDEVLVELGRQPPGRYTTGIARLSEASGGFVSAPIDPSRGKILSLLVDTPSTAERISFGGVIGYIVIGLGSAAFLFGLLKLVQLFLAQVKVASQLRSSTIKTSNPLGRILNLSQSTTNLDVESFEARLDEGVLRESAKLESGIWVVRVVQIAAPLLGLLGTVTGIIYTFQAITLLGTRDPRLMAGGISEALVTTMLGLITAIPLVLLTNLLTNMSKRIIDILDEQAAGMVAERIESSKGA